MKARRIVVALVLVVSHLAAYFISRGAITPPPTGTAAPSTASATIAASGKSTERPPSLTEHAALLGELTALPLGRQEYLELRRELFRDWIRRDLRGALDMIYGVETCGRFGTFDTELGEELEQAMADNGRQAWHWIATGRYGSNRQPVFQRWLAAVMRKGQRDLAIELLGEFPHPFLLYATESLSERAKPEELQILRKAWDARVEDPDERAKQASFYAERKVQLAKGKLDEILAGEADPMLRKELAAAWVEQELDDLTGAQAVTAFAQLPAELRPGALPALLEGDPHGGYPMVVEMLDEVGRQNLWEGIAEEDRQGIISRMIDYPFSRFKDAGHMFGELAKLQDPAVRKMALAAAGEIARLYARQGSSLAGLDQMAAGENRDAVISGIVMGDIYDEEFYVQIVTRVADEGLRKELMERLHPTTE